MDVGGMIRKDYGITGHGRNRSNPSHFNHACHFVALHSRWVDMFVNIHGARIHYSDAGEGIPTLFLHGIPDSGAVWNDVIAAMRGGYRCIAPDLPGFGGSAVPGKFKVSDRKS